MVDTLKSLFVNTYEYICYFDHNSSHDKTCPDGLCANEMNKCVGGKQNRMGSKKIENETYLGHFIYSQKLQVGESQSMTFQEGDSSLIPFKK